MNRILRNSGEWYRRNGATGSNVAKIPVTPLWTPSAITTAMWLDASDSSTITIATGVSEWNDKSGNARNATQAIGANQPLVIANAFNGLQVIRFDGSNDTLTYNGSFLANTDYTIIGIYARRSNKIKNFILSGSGIVGNDNIVVGWTTNTQFSLNQWANDLNVTVAGYSSSIAQILEVTHNTTDGKLIRSNGTTIASNASGGLVVSYAGSNLGHQPYENTYYNGDIGELIYFTSTPSASNREKVEGYLAWKWDLVASLPNDHPYKNSAPTT